MFQYAGPAAGLSRLSYRMGGWSNAFIDYDNDGWKDIYSANGDVDYIGDNAKQSDTMLPQYGRENAVGCFGGYGAILRA